MLPPTSTTAPTSDSAEPIAAIVAASTPTRASRNASAATRTREAPSARAWSRRPTGTAWIAAALRAATTGRASSDWARMMPFTV